MTGCFPSLLPVKTLSQSGERTGILPPIRAQLWLRWSEPELGEASSVELPALVVESGQRTLYSPSVRSDVVCLLRDAKSMMEWSVPKYPMPVTNFNNHHKQMYTKQNIHTKQKLQDLFQYYFIFKYLTWGWRASESSWSACFLLFPDWKFPNWKTWGHCTCVVCSGGCQCRCFYYSLMTNLLASTPLDCGCCYRLILSGFLSHGPVIVVLTRIQVRDLWKCEIK